MSTPHAPWGGIPDEAWEAARPWDATLAAVEEKRACPGFLLCGECTDYVDSHVRLLRIVSSGDTVWNRLYTGAIGAGLGAVCPTAYNGFLVAEDEFDSLLYVVTDCGDLDASCEAGSDVFGIGVESLTLIVSDTATRYVIVDGFSINLPGDKNPYYGAGARVNVSRNLSLIGDWTRFELDTANADTISIGFQYRFGR